MGTRIQMLQTVEDSHAWPVEGEDGKIQMKYHVYIFREGKFYDGRMKTQRGLDIDEFGDAVIDIVDMPGDWERRQRRLVKLGYAKAV